MYDLAYLKCQNSNEFLKTILQSLSDICLIMRRGEAHLASRRSKIDRGNVVFDVWTSYYEAIRFTCEAHAVISARFILIASGDPRGAAEAYRMISEKAIAFAEAQSAAEQALAEGLGIYEAAERAYLPLCQCVHENSRRLSGAVH